MEGFHVSPDASGIAFAAVGWRENARDFVVEGWLGLRGAHSTGEKFGNIKCSRR